MRVLRSLSVFLTRVILATIGTCLLSILALFMLFPGPYGDMLAFGGIVAAFFMPPYHLFVIVVSAGEALFSARLGLTPVLRAGAVVTFLFMVDLIAPLAFFGIRTPSPLDDWRISLLTSGFIATAATLWGFLYWALFTLAGFVFALRRRLPDSS